MKKIPTILVVAFCLMSVSTVNAQVKLEHQSFTDIDELSLNFTAIEYVKDLGVINGYEDGTFGPEKEINRAELITIVVNMMTDDIEKEEDVAGNEFENCFPDVTDQWFAKAVCYAKKQGWANGYEDGLFRPGNKTSRAAATKIILNAYHDGADNIPILTNVEKAFLDAPLDLYPEDWYYDLVIYGIGANLYDQGHTVYHEGSYFFKPLDNIRRLEVAEMIYRIDIMQTAKIENYEYELNGDWEYSNPRVINGKDGMDGLTMTLELVDGEITGDFIAVFSTQYGGALYTNIGKINGTYGGDFDNGAEVTWEGDRNDSGKAYITYDPIERIVKWEVVEVFEEDMLYSVPRAMKLHEK